MELKYGLLNVRAVVSKCLVILPLCAVLSSVSGVARADDIEEAMRFYDSGHYVHAVDRFRAAAIAGNAQAQEILALMYALGSEVYPGVPRDAHAAAHWFDIAARNGRPVSRYLACAMRHGAAEARARKLHCFDWVAEVGKPGPR
jgi:TPR repeat protein